MNALERPRTTITSGRNALLKRIRRAAQKPDEFCVAEGPHLVEEALAAGVGIQAILFDERHAPEISGAIPAGIAVHRVSHRLFAELATTETPQGVLALAARPRWTAADLFAAPEPLIVLLDGVQDPGNVGTILRSAAALGASGAILLGGSADPFNPKSLRGSAGASFRLPLLTHVSAEQAIRLLRERGLALLAAVARGGKSLAEVDCRRPVALAVGNEAAGLSRALLEAADERVSVPMRRAVESLNAAMAAAMALYEAARQRGFRY